MFSLMAIGLMVKYKPGGSRAALPPQSLFGYFSGGAVGGLLTIRAEQVTLIMWIPLGN